MNRRGFLRGILAAGVAPYVVTSAGVLMPARSVIPVVVSDIDLYEGGITWIDAEYEGRFHPEQMLREVLPQVGVPRHWLIG